MIAKISTGPSDSFHRDEQNPGQDQAHFQYPLVHVSRITERTGATHMPQQIDVRDHRKCNDHDSLSSSRRGSRRIVTMILRRLCRNVDVSPDKERSEKIRLGSFRQWRYIDNRSTYISTEIVVARYRGVSRATGKANLARAGLTARCAWQHGLATAKSRRRAGCRVRSSGRRQSCGECDRANSHPAKTATEEERPAEWGWWQGT
jgi:hypothetical protein